MENISLAIKRQIEYIKKRRKNIIFIMILAMSLSIILKVFFVEEKYQVKSLMYIGPYEGEVLDNSEKYNNLRVDYGKEINSLDFMSKAFENADINIDTTKAIKGLDIINNVDESTMEIKYTSNDKELCQKIGKALNNSFITKYKRLVDRGNIKLIDDAVISNEPINKNVFIISIYSMFVAFILTSLFYILIGNLEVRLKNFKM